jgi:hypothetical protein
MRGTSYGNTSRGVELEAHRPEPVRAYAAGRTGAHPVVSDTYGLGYVVAGWLNRYRYLPRQPQLAVAHVRRLAALVEVRMVLTSVGVTMIVCACTPSGGGSTAAWFDPPDSDRSGPFSSGIRRCG